MARELFPSLTRPPDANTSYSLARSSPPCTPCGRGAWLGDAARSYVFTHLPANVRSGSSSPASSCALFYKGGITFLSVTHREAR